MGRTKQKIPQGEFVRTHTQLAVRLGVSPQLISYHVRRVDAPKPGPKGHNVQEWADYFKRGKNTTATDTGETKSSREKVWHWKAVREELKAKEEQGSLIPLDQVREVFTRAVMAAKTTLIGSQATLAALIVSLPPGDAVGIQEKIAARDREVMDRLSSCKWYEEGDK